MPKKGGDEQDTSPCKVCGKRVQIVVVREFAALKGHKNKGGNWCPGRYAPPASVMNSTECPGEIRGPDGTWRACGAILTYGASFCRRCKTNFAPGALAGIRVPRHAKAPPVKRSWAKRFLCGD